jgi:hypothetical protein
MHFAPPLKTAGPTIAKARRFTRFSKWNRNSYEHLHAPTRHGSATVMSHLRSRNKLAKTDTMLNYKIIPTSCGIPIKLAGVLHQVGSSFAQRVSPYG